MTIETSSNDKAELLALKSLLTDLRFEIALRRFVRKYSPDQPRDDRGRWTEGTDRTQSNNATSNDKAPTDISAARRPLGGIAKQFWRWTVREFVS